MTDSELKAVEEKPPWGFSNGRIIERLEWTNLMMKGA